MIYRVDSKVVLLRAPEGPFANHLKPFAKSVREKGYAPYTVHRKVLLAENFSRWLKKQKVRPCSINSGHVAQYLKYRSQRVLLRSDDAVSLRHFLEFLRRENVIPAERIAPPQLTQAEQCAQAYEQYLRETRALAQATIINYLPFIHRFLKERFGNGRVTLSCLRARDVVEFVQREAPRLHLKQAKLMTCALRSFLQYIRFSGEVTLDLAAAVPVVANWSMPSIPRAIAPEQVNQLLNSIDQSTAIGRRDYAVLLLLARLGLRLGEVTYLELDDIDWNKGLLRVRGKTGQRSQLPLPAEVGKAIAAYLSNGRPDSTSRRVFLRVKAPVGGFKGVGGVGSIVRHSLQRAGVAAPTYGAHQFRHGLATEMLRKGASLAEIGEVLGHRHPETTKIYTKVDIKSLRTLALPWPGGAK